MSAGTELPAFPADIDPADWPELSYRLGLTDGLPTFPPSREVVEALVAGSGRRPDDVVGVMPPSGRTATVLDVAANAAMAGCLPEHLPAVLAALEAMQEPRFNLAGVVATTHPCWPLVIVSGSAVQRLAMATAESVMSGGGVRANVAIGRAVKLVIWNVGGGRPREPVQEIFGHPGRLSYCIAESPSLALAGAARGARRAGPARRRDRFRLRGAADHQPVGLQHVGQPAHRRAVARHRRRPDVHASGNNNTHTMGEMLVAFTPSMARTLAQQGWTPRKHPAAGSGRRPAAASATSG